MKRKVSKILETFLSIFGKTNVKPIVEKIMSSILYKLVSYLAVGYALIASIWNIFFHDEFLARTTLHIFYLVAFAWILLNEVLNAIVKKGKKFDVVFWIAIFLMYFVVFVFR